MIGSEGKSATENKSITEVVDVINSNIRNIKDSINKDVQE
jgi:hypothetical protein